MRVGSAKSPVLTRSGSAAHPGQAPAMPTALFASATASRASWVPELRPRPPVRTSSKASGSSQAKSQPQMSSV